MKNILSFQNGIFTGEEILNWAKYHYENKTSHYKAAKKILHRYEYLIPTRKYHVFSSYHSEFNPHADVKNNPFIISVM